MDWRALSVLIIAGCAIFPFSLHAQENADAGKTVMARGAVNAVSEVSNRALKRRSPVFLSDTVETGEQSAAQLRMIDGALLSLQEQSELSIASYQFNPTDNQGTVRMSLLKGGLRTITGALQKGDENYQLTTPVASIGVRGTHYEAELVEQDLYLAAWDGIIDVAVSVGEKLSFSLGPEQAYRFAIVYADGTVSFLLSAPKLFASGYSPALPIQTTELQMAGLQSQPSDALAGLPLEAESAFGVSASQLTDNERLTANWIPASVFETERSGSVLFNDPVNFSLQSSAGPVSDFSMRMEVNFSSATIPVGDLSFNDSEGEWFAAFNGVVNDDLLDISVNFVSHNNNLATGNIDALLIDAATGVLGNISLSEIDDPGIYAGGSFELRAGAQR